MSPHFISKLYVNSKTLEPHPLLSQVCKSLLLEMKPAAAE